MRPLLLGPIVLIAACGIERLPEPCSNPSVPASVVGASGGTFVLAHEQLPSGVFLRRFDGSGQPLAQVKLDVGDAEDSLFAAGSTAFLVDGTGQIAGVDASGRGFAVTPPLGCSPPTAWSGWFASEGDRLRVFGSAGGQPCTYRVDGSGNVDDAHLFATVGAGDRLRLVAGGGFLQLGADRLVRYDADAQALWTHAGSFRDMAAAGGNVYALAQRSGTSSNGQVDLVRIGSDGQGETVLRSWSFTYNLEINALASLADGGLILVLQTSYLDPPELVRIDAAGQLSAHTLTALANQTVGAAQLGADFVALQTPSVLTAFDFAGQLRWKAGAVAGFAVAGDGSVVVADSKPLDACRAVLRLSRIDVAGDRTVMWSVR